MRAAALPLRLELGSQSLWPLYALGATGVITVICIAGATFSQITQKQTREASLSTQRAVARVQLLRSTLPSGAAGAATASAAQAVPIPVASVASAPLASGPAPATTTTVTAAAVPNPARPAQAPRLARTPTKPAPTARAERSSASETAPAPRNSPPPAVQAPVATPLANVTPEMVASAKTTNKIEGIDGARLGVSQIGADTVFLKNGSSIKIGGKFPSGEVLLQLDPDNGQIVTTKRTLLVF